MKTMTKARACFPRDAREHTGMSLSRPLRRQIGLTIPPNVLVRADKVIK